MLKDVAVRTYVHVLKAIALRSTCKRLQVACLLVQDDRIISTGWNGVPSGHEHCCEHFKHVQDTGTEQFRAEHREFSELYELHAEMNAFAFANLKAVSAEGADVFCTLSPCLYCAKLMVAHKVRAVYFMDLYDRHSEDSFKVLRHAGIQIYQIRDEKAVQL